jgi:glycosyltransferase involved in cell wall biosynthesis
MLLVADGDDVSDLLPADDPSISLIHIEPGYTIGEKRNFGCDRADGEIIAHWDDDDWSAPDRLEDQVRRLQESRLEATGYQHVLFTNGTQWWKYHGIANYAVGTSLCYRKEFWRQNRFPARQVGEDGHFVARANAERQLIAVDAGELMVATVHAGNTSPRSIHGEQWELLRDFPGVAGFGMPNG